ncbi:hypothetical protein CFAM422_010352 [Trichoderma lentiforme]|uniref:Uncharacterized protein n=1 Tax=Trichoderma lentiforme TaxID=1567552 RepID=A0A9P4X7Q6_9HYPO|nr:hypothetical protein CFAM422_010352 [Trichoderma lentiforme]
MKRKKNINSNEGLRMKDCAPEGKQARCVGFASVPPPIWYSGAGCDSDAHGEERIATWGKRIVSYAMQQP